VKTPETHPQRNAEGWPLWAVTFRRRPGARAESWALYAPDRRAARDYVTAKCAEDGDHDPVVGPAIAIAIA